MDGGSTGNAGAVSSESRYPEIMNRNTTMNDAIRSSVQQLRNSMPPWLQRLSVTGTEFFKTKELVWTGVGVWVVIRQ